MLGPATHRIDAPIIYIHPLDDAWDRERIEAERETLRGALATALESSTDPKRRAAIACDMRHPVDVYYSGATRYDLDAPLKLWTSATEKPQPVTARGYLRGPATEFTLRRLDSARWSVFSATMLGSLQTVLASRPDLSPEEIARLARGDELARRDVLRVSALTGIVSVTGLTWKGTEDDLELLHAMSSDLISEVGSAVFSASRPLTAAELFHSA